MTTPKEAMQAGLRASSRRAEPGLEAAAIDAFEKELPGRLPPEIRELLAFSAGLEPGEGLVELLDFRGGTGGFELKGAFPCCVPVGGDGAGNFWVVDVDPETGSWGTVFYACHDPPVLVVQAASLADFLQQLFEPGETTLERVACGADMTIWREDPFLLPADHPSLAAGEEVRAFAAQLGPGFRVADLRNREIGTGFSWGRHAPEADVRRMGKALVFAVERRERKGLLRRLFGG